MDRRSFLRLVACAAVTAVAGPLLDMTGRLPPDDIVLDPPEDIRSAALTACVRKFVERTLDEHCGRWDEAHDAVRKGLAEVKRRRKSGDLINGFATITSCTSLSGQDITVSVRILWSWRDEPTEVRVSRGVGA